MTQQKRLNPVACDPRELRLVENWPTAHGARARWRTWRCCLCSQRGARSTPRRWPRIFFYDTVLGRRLRLRSNVTKATESDGARPRSLRQLILSCRPPTEHPARRRTWRGCIRGQFGACSNPRRWPRLFFAVTAIDRRLRLQNAVARAFSFCATRPARYSPCGDLADRPRSTRVLADLALLSLRPTRGALHPTPLAEALLQLHRARSPAAALKRRNISFQIRWRAARAGLRPVDNLPSAHGARARWRTWNGFLRGQIGARSTPRHWARLFFTDTATGRRLRLRNVVIEGSEYRGARPSLASPREEPADRQRSTCTLAGFLEWLSSWQTRPLRA